MSQLYCRKQIPHLTANEYAADAMAADNDEWITYVPSPAKEAIEPFEEWLANNLPSQTLRSDGIGWICVRSPTYTDDDSDSESDSDSEETSRRPIEAQDSFEQLQASGRPVNRQTLTELAKKHSITDGKWLLHTSTGLKVDHLWSLVARGVVSARCGMSAKVSPYDPTQQGEKHVICIYNEDFTDYDQVMDLENSIRNLGIKCSLMYKPDIYTILGVYRNNQWGIMPTIYKSDYDLVKRTSKVVETTSYADVSRANTGGYHDMNIRDNDL